MESRAHLLAFVDLCGGRPQAAEKLGIPYSTLAAICNGTRGVSRAMADRMATNSGGMLDARKLIWIAPTPADPQQKAA